MKTSTLETSPTENNPITVQLKKLLEKAGGGPELCNDPVDICQPLANAVTPLGVVEAFDFSFELNYM